MRDHSHLSPEEEAVCEHCGQSLKRTPSYGERGASNRTGIGVSIVLHLLLVLAFLLYAKPLKKAPPPAGATMVYLTQSKARPKARSAPQKPRQKQKQAKPVMPRLPFNPNAITLPREPEQDVAVEVPKAAPPPPEMDMEAMIAERRRQRQAQSGTDVRAAEESAAERGLRLAKANIASANGRSAGRDRDETGGVFTLLNRTSLSADVKFRGWNVNFKRNWSQLVHVELGQEPDLENAIVKKMIELIRKEKTGDFTWDSHRLGRTVPMSARVEHSAELHAFLMQEMFPDYRPPPGR